MSENQSRTFTFMIVDDAKYMRAKLRNLLEGAGYKVVGEAGDGAEALVKYKELLPDLVTMDITMPEMSGVEALKAIKEFDPAAVVVMITAMGMQQNVAEAIQCGSKDFIVKPFDDERVLGSLSRIIRNHFQ